MRVHASMGSFGIGRSVPNHGGNPSGALVACPVSLQEGRHQLSFVGVFGSRVESAPIDLVVDCEAPSVSAVSIVQDADNDGCINEQERSNAGAASGTARVSVRVDTVGMEDGQNLRILSESGTILANGLVNGNTTTIAVELNDGARRVYATGADAVGTAADRRAGFVGERSDRYRPRRHLWSMSTKPLA